MRLLPHEREPAERFAGRPFALVGVNGDDKPEAARQAVTKHRVVCRSFRDRRPDQPAISEAWHVGGWPTRCLIDHAGTVRRGWVDAPKPADLGRAVAELAAKAERP